MARAHGEIRFLRKKERKKIGLLSLCLKRMKKHQASVKIMLYQLITKRNQNYSTHFIHIFRENDFQMF